MIQYFVQPAEQSHLLLERLKNVNPIIRKIKHSVPFLLNFHITLLITNLAWLFIFSESAEEGETGILLSWNEFTLVPSIKATSRTTVSLLDADVTGSNIVAAIFSHKWTTQNWLKFILWKPSSLLRQQPSDLEGKWVEMFSITFKNADLCAKDQCQRNTCGC